MQFFKVSLKIMKPSSSLSIPDLIHTQLRKLKLFFLLKKVVLRKTSRLQTFPLLAWLISSQLTEMVLHISTTELAPETQISVHLHILEMECNTFVGTSLNKEEDAMVEAPRKATTNLNVNFVEELVMLSCSATTNLINLS